MSKRDIPSPFVALGPSFSGKAGKTGRHSSGKNSSNDKPGAATGKHHKPARTTHIGGIKGGDGFFGTGVW